MACPRCASEKIMDGEINPVEFMPQTVSRNIIGLRRRISHVDAKLCIECGKLFELKANLEDIKKYWLNLYENI